MLATTRNPLYPHASHAVRWQFAVVCLGLVMMIGGCSRSWHRKRADRDAYCLIESRQIDPRWEIPKRTVEPDPRSRLADHDCPDCGPKPLDDHAADQFTRRPKARHNGDYYDSICTDPEVDDLHWLTYLPRTPEGKVKLTEQTVNEIALLHSRDFQSQVEQLYLSGLNLAGQRFEFQTQWFGGSGTDFVAVSDAPNAVRNLAENNRLGFVKSLAAGGQLTSTLVNSFVWELGSNSFNQANGSFVVGLTQPLLRGAFRHVRLNSLTQSERGLLYNVRDFARFRRAFYLDTVSSYLGLLTQIQAKRNLERNLESLQINLDEFSERLVRGQISQIEYDQVFQNVQNGRISLLSAEQGLLNSFDAFKFQLGLPAWVEVELDESLLESFELSDPALEKLQADTQALYQQLTQTLPPEVPERDALVEVHKEMIGLQRQAIKLLPQIAEDVKTWQRRLKELKPGEIGKDDRLDVIQQKRLSQQVGKLVDDLAADLKNDLEIAEKWDVDDPAANRKLSDLFFTVDDFLAENRELGGDDVPELDKTKELTGDEKLVVSWTQLTRMLGRRLRERLANMFVAQTQTRLFFIDIKPTKIEQSQAVAFALENRLDLKNVRGRLTDAFRNVEVAADALESDLTVSASATLGTDNDNAFRFDSNANRYNVGVQFDGPLNRYNEGNAYRAAQITYQASRRQLLASQDGITNQVRADLRAVRISRLNFQIGRQQLISSIRQVDEAQIRLRTAAGGGNDSSPTQDLLNALSGLLSAKNALISNRIGHEIARINLFVDLELLYLDEAGQWVNKESDPAEFAGQVFDSVDGENSIQNKNSLEQLDEMSNDSVTNPELNQDAPRPDFEPTEPSEPTDKLELDGPDLGSPTPEKPPSDAGLKLEQPQPEIDSSGIVPERSSGD